jgi:hypothetical protein
MPLPAIIAKGLPIVSGLFGLGGALGQNAAQRRMAEQQQGFATRIGNSADEISRYVADLMRMQSGLSDERGGSIRINPVTGQWETVLSPQDRALQEANDREALARDTIDQFLRRQGMFDAERLRGRAATAADTLMDDLDANRRGIGTVDPTAIARQLEVDRTGAVNAGYDEVLRGLNRVSMRTGSDGSAVAAALARNRAADIARTRGSPMIEGLQIAQNYNTNARNNLLGEYGGMFSGGSNFLNSSFAGTDRFGNALDRTAQQQGFDLSRRQTGIQGGAVGGQLLSNAARGLRETPPVGGGVMNALSGFTGSLANLLRSPKG